jgi:hypothetical protein
MNISHTCVVESLLVAIRGWVGVTVGEVGACEVWEGLTGGGVTELVMMVGGGRTSASTVCCLFVL